MGEDSRKDVPLHRLLIEAGKSGINALEERLWYEYHPKSRHSEHANLGRTLIDLNALTPEQLDEALKEQERTGKLLGRILVEKEMVSERALTFAMAHQLGIDFVDITRHPSSINALQAVGETTAVRRRMLPLDKNGDCVRIAVTNPQGIEELRALGTSLGIRLEPALTWHPDFRGEIQRRYREQGRVDPPENAETEPQRAREENMPDRSGKQEETGESRGSSLERVAAQAHGMPVVRLVQRIIEGAVEAGATDLHLDPQGAYLRVRYRIDGILHDVMSIERDTLSAVISRVKLLADLDITETRHSQDGHIRVTIQEREYDIRVATLPTYTGERVVLRLLDQSQVLKGLGDLGLHEDDQKVLENHVKQPYGMILVTGPTGSGKTTTLYAALNERNAIEESIVTLENPVEYQIANINQVQIEPEIGITFAATLRAALRQDIDVILVGEIRDPETAQIAVRAAMTGHLVFSTLHTNDAPDALGVLRNMGLPAYLLASALSLVVGQRLVRRVCPECKKRFRPAKTLLKSLGLPDSTKSLYKGEGCDTCFRTGNLGRTGVFELFETTGPVRDAIANEAPIKELLKLTNYHPMTERCREKLKKGAISPEEFLRMMRS